MDFGQVFCQKCGTKLITRELTHEGVIPYCEACGEYRFPMYNVAVSMIVIDEKTSQILLIRQYGKPQYILVAGYVTRGERAEDAVIREVREETGLSVSRIEFNRTRFFEKSNTLMLNFAAYVRDMSRIRPNHEIDSYHWFTPQDARRSISPGSLAEEFLKSFLNEF